MNGWLLKSRLSSKNFEDYEKRNYRYLMCTLVHISLGTRSLDIIIKAKADYKENQVFDHTDRQHLSINNEYGILKLIDRANLDDQ